jgi:hypothetical protein
VSGSAWEAFRTRFEKASHFVSLAPKVRRNMARGKAPGNKAIIIKPHRGEVNNICPELIKAAFSGYLGRCPKLYYSAPLALKPLIYISQVFLKWCFYAHQVFLKSNYLYSNHRIYKIFEKGISEEQ